MYIHLGRLSQREMAKVSFYYGWFKGSVAMSQCVPVRIT